jgi:hypothetical protein
MRENGFGGDWLLAGIPLYPHDSALHHPIQQAENILLDIVAIYAFVLIKQLVHNGRDALLSIQVRENLACRALQLQGSFGDQHDCFRRMQPAASREPWGGIQVHLSLSPS